MIGDFDALNAIADFLDRLDGEPGGSMQRDLRRIAADLLRRDAQWVQFGDLTLRVDDIESFERVNDKDVMIRTASGREFGAELADDEMRELLR